MSAAATASPAQINGLQYPMANGVRKRKSLAHSIQNLEAVVSTKTPKLPLKKRFYAEETPSTESRDKTEEKSCQDESSKIPKPEPITDEHSTETGETSVEPSDKPVDFSLPNRVRAKSTPSKNFVKSEPGLVHSPSDTTATSLSPASSDDPGLKPSEEPSDTILHNANSPKSPKKALHPSAFSPAAPWTQTGFLEALRMSSGPFNASIPPMFAPPGLGLGPFSLVPQNLSSLAGSMAPGAAGLFPPAAGQIFQSGPAADLNLLKSLSLAAAAASAQSHHQLKQPKAVEGTQVSPGPSSSASNFLLEGQSGQEAAFFGSEQPETFVINPATGNKVRKNYKNMTRERRVEANARERTRVHTIGSAFDNIRKLIPCLAPDQKLSKLSILRIGCKYILLLAAMNGEDYSADQRGYSVDECVEMLNETIISESKAKRFDR